MRLREVNWIGSDAPAGGAAAPREVHVKVRSTRPPQPAWLRFTPEGAEVDLVDGEDGVSPGQACVFYDAAGGQARVLGGGIIASAAGAEQRAAEPALAAHGLRAARG
jgi:tRNA-specific 2-thiouridylase